MSCGDWPLLLQGELVRLFISISKGNYFPNRFFGAPRAVLEPPAFGLMLLGKLLKLLISPRMDNSLGTAFVFGANL